MYSYDTVDYSWADDDGTAWPNLARKETEYVLGQVVRQTQRIVRATGSPAVVEWVKEFQVPYEDADVLDPGVVAASLVTKTTFYTTGAFAGRVKNVLAPDQTLTTYAYQDSGGNRTTTVRRGQPNGAFDAVTAGSQTVTVVSQDGRTLSSTTTVIGGPGNGLTTASTGYSNFDSQGRAQTVTHLDGKTETHAYGCCGLDSFTAKDGTVTTYGYDNAKRRVSETTAGVTTLTDYDPAGHAWRTRRRGTDQSLITLSQSTYNTAGELISTINQMGATTTYADTLVSGVRTRTTTEAVGLPEVATRIETYYQDGQLKETSGTGASPLRYEHGIEADNTGGDLGRLFQKTIRLATGGGTSEWTKSYTDFFGRGYKTIYADATPSDLANNPASQSFFHASTGRLIKQVDPDGVITLFLRQNLNEDYTVVDMDRDSVIDWTGPDRITKTLTEVVSEYGTTTRRVTTSEYKLQGNASATVLSVTSSSVDGLRTWTTTTGAANPAQTQITYPGSGYRNVTSTAPDGSYSVSQYQYGRLVTQTQYTSTGSQVSRLTYQYDTHGRQWRVIDARNGTTTYGYDNADQVTTVTSPAPGNGQPAQVVTTVYDVLGRAKQITQPDGTVVTTEYYPTGQVKKTSGSRTYPVAYVHDAQGRMTRLATWSVKPANWSTLAMDDTSLLASGAALTKWNYSPYRGWLDTKRYHDLDGSGSTYQSEGPDFTYTKGGRMKTRQWARKNAGNQRLTTTWTYGFENSNGPEDAITKNDSADVVKISYTNDPQNTPETTFAFDRCGHPTVVVRNGLTTARTFSSVGSLLTESFSGAGTTLNGLSVETTYDTSLRRSTVTPKNGSTALASATYTYDTASRLATVTDGTFPATYAYLANSYLPGTVTFKQSSTTRLTTSRSFDLLNRMQAVQNTPAGANQLPDLSAYHYNDANQRVRRTLADGSYWAYSYDALGQVTGGKRYWNDGTPVAGQQFEYAFDHIGNRTGANGAKMGGDQNGSNLRPASYTPNALNQYTSRTVPGYVDILGLATASTAVDVSINGSTAGVYERGEYFWKALSVPNGGGPVWQSVTVNQNGGTATSGNVLVPPAIQSFSYDLDGNLLSDGLWTYTWDAENRLIELKSATTLATAGRRRLTFEYDDQGRRIGKKVFLWASSDYATSPTTQAKFLHDGWNVVVELDGSNQQTRTYLWGNDLSGTPDGAGGVGGLLKVTHYTWGGVPNPALSHQFVGYDGNGNVTGLVDGTSGNLTAAYEYGPFGELLRASGPQAKNNLFRFSTKYHDPESDLLYYGHRFYSPSLGRWISRDPSEEHINDSLYSFVGNNSVGNVD